MSERVPKKFRLSASEIEPLAKGYGGCVASDMITVEGRKVAFMIREQPEEESDSGWSFFSGFESDDYMSDPGNFEVYDVNTIANYDPEVIQFLDAPFGSAFERQDGSGPLVRVEEEARPEHPIVEGHQRLTSDWSIDLPGRFKRRLEEGDLHFWRPGLTVVLAVWGNDDHESPQQRLAWIREDMSPDAYDIIEETQDTLLRFAYRLHEESDDERQDALYGFVIADLGHVQVAVYFDDEPDVEVAWSILRSIAA